MRRVSAQFEGHVQGVGFRFTTTEIARRHGVSGYVQNCEDGSVRLVAEGREEALNRFLDALRQSSVFRYVRREHLNWSPPTAEFTSFEIRYG